MPAVAVLRPANQPTLYAAVGNVIATVEAVLSIFTVWAELVVALPA